MAGYMGFGMASWIYKQRPKKAFSKRKRKPTCNTLPTYNRTFKLQPSKTSGNLYILISLLLIGLLFVAVYTKVPDFMEHSKTIEIQKQKRIEYSNNSAFEFLMSSGWRRLRSNNLAGAYSEFKLAYDIYPDHEGLYEILVETLGALCIDENSYCKALDDLLDSSL